jgi:putative tricarboxylic transport membrane protein
MSQPDSPTSYAPKRPWWLGLAVIGFGAVWIWGALQLSISDRLSGIGPGSVVLIVGVALVILGAILLVQISRGETFEAEQSEDAIADAPVSYPRLAMVGVAVFLPTLIMSKAGFPLTGALSYMLIARALGATNLVLNVMIGFGLSVICWYAFEKLGVQLGGFLPVLGF